MSKDYKTVNYSGVYKMTVCAEQSKTYVTSIEYQALITIVTDGCGHYRESHISKIEDVEVSLENADYDGEFEWLPCPVHLGVGIELDIENKFSRGLIE